MREEGRVERGREKKRGRERRERDRGKLVMLIIFMILTHTSDILTIGKYCQSQQSLYSSIVQFHYSSMK